jgi:Uma2 family endonuclease
MYIGNALIEQLRVGPCRVYSSDLNVRVKATGLATYPDVTVVCGPLERDPEHENTITNPTVVIEVTSRSSEKYDRGDKLDHYRQAPSIQAVVIVAHREPRIDVWNRVASGWVQSAAGAGEKSRIECLGCDLDVSAIYTAAGLAI